MTLSSSDDVAKTFRPQPSYQEFMSELRAAAKSWKWSSKEVEERLHVAFSTETPIVLDVSNEEVRDWMRDAHKDGWTIEPLSCLVAETLIRMTGAKTAMDIGTHFGFISLFLLRIGQLEKVTGIEMNPGARDAVLAHMALEENHALNPRTRYQMLWAALSDRDEVDATVWYSGMHLRFEPHPRFTEAQMSVRSLASICDELGAVPDFIKIDIEGFEGRLVQDLNKLLDSNRPVVLLEMHWDEVVERHGTTRAEILDLFLSRGYTAARLNWHQKMPKQNYAVEVTPENASEMLAGKQHAMYALF